jgi:hypothetical protein
MGAAIVVRLGTGDGFDDEARARVGGGDGRSMSTACTMRSGAHARRVFGVGKRPGAKTDAASSAARTIAWTVTETTTKDDRR